jgi:hypothetical protein
VSAAETPTVDLPVQAVCCAVHGEPFRHQWPAGYPTFAVTILKAALAAHELIDAAGGDTARLNAAIAEFGPLCRLVDAEARLEAYQAAAKSASGWRSHGICAMCRKWKPGTPFSGRVRGGVITRHVFECVAHRECGT